MQYLFKFLLVISIGLFVSSCNNETKNSVKKNSKKKIIKARVNVPRINADTIYNYVKKQVEFGPRVPGSNAHLACKNWLKSKFEFFGANVILQEFEAKLYTGESFPSTNIIAQINPSHKDRIVLAAHWDSRFWGENDIDPKNKIKPIDGADDGASGVGVLLEIARIIQLNPIDLGVDLILFDAEDNGSRDPNTSNTWCLGSQYWSKNLHKKKYSAQYGILLDMVGAKGATFYKEGYSTKFAPLLQNKIWSLAQKMNSGNLFLDQQGGTIVDDHYYVNTITGIKMVDIINTKHKSPGFGAHWHTQNDNIDIIDKNTLKKVAQLVTAVTYKTSDNSL